MILAAEKWSALDHLCQDAAHTPHVYRRAISLRGHFRGEHCAHLGRRRESSMGHAPLNLARAPAVGTRV